MSGEDQHSVHSSNPDDQINVSIKSTDIEAQDSDVMDTSPLEDVTENVADSAEVAPRSASASSQSSSFHPPSLTSTEEFDQTPFVDFTKQVNDLCHSMWPPSAREYRIQRLLGGPNSRFMGVLRSKKLGRYLWPPSPPKAFEIEHMAGGSYNRVTGIKIIGSEKEDPTPLVLRTPRYPDDSHLAREIAILQYIRHHTKIPVPHIQAFDLTEDNPLKTPYVIQNRIPGSCLETVQNGLSHKQWCTIAKEIAHVILELQTTVNPTPGLIEASTKDEGLPEFSVCAFDIRNPREVGWRQRQEKSPDYAADKATALKWYAKDTLYFLATQFGRWEREKLRNCPFDILYFHHMRHLSRVALEMNARGIFGENKNCLAHMDLAARNIMVETGPDDFIKLTGVLDWDLAVFAPVFVSCRPPWWLWQDQSFPEDAMEEEANANHGAADDPELIELKSIFDDIMGEEYVRCAYEPQFQLARRLFTIAVHGIWSGEAFKEADAIVQEWDTLKDTLTRANCALDDEDSVESVEEDENST